jgi:DNA-binding NtrC family response regulator
MEKNQEKIRLLLVDDEFDFLESAGKALNRRGFEVIPAFNGKEALAIAEKNRDLKVALLDVKMPDIDGHKLFYRMKEILPEAKFVMLTGHGSIKKAFELSKAGVFDYLGKPCEMDKLAEVMRSAYLAALAATDAKAETKTEETIIPGSIRLLIVDDEEEYLNSIARTLKRRGLVVYQADNGLTALEILSQEVIDVAVVDIKMPGMGGLEFLKRIKTETINIEVILLTGHATVESALRGMKEGAFDYLLKPQDINELVTKIRAAYEKKRAHEESVRAKRIQQIIEDNPS